MAAIEEWGKEFQPAGWRLRAQLQACRCPNVFLFSALTTVRCVEPA